MYQVGRAGVACTTVPARRTTLPTRMHMGTTYYIKVGGCTHHEVPHARGVPVACMAGHRLRSNIVDSVNKDPVLLHPVTYPPPPVFYNSYYYQVAKTSGLGPLRVVAHQRVSGALNSLRLSVVNHG